jgi:ankyrin repeat protein
VTLSQLLVERGAILDAAHHESGRTAFHLACLHDRPDCAEALMRAGCNTKVLTSTQITGRQIADSTGHARVLERMRKVVAEQLAGGAALPEPAFSLRTLLSNAKVDAPPPSLCP